MTCPVLPGADNCFRSVGSCSSCSLRPDGAHSVVSLPSCLQSWGLAHATSVTHAPGVQDPALFAPAPSPSVPVRLTIASTAAAAAACSPAPTPLPCAASVPAARGGSRGAGRACGPRGRGARLLRGARPRQTESGDRTRGAPPTGPPASDFR